MDKLVPHHADQIDLTASVAAGSRPAQQAPSGFQQPSLSRRAFLGVTAGLTAAAVGSPAVATQNQATRNLGPMLTITWPRTVGLSDYDPREPDWRNLYNQLVSKYLSDQDTRQPENSPAEKKTYFERLRSVPYQVRDRLKDEAKESARRMYLENLQNDTDLPHYSDGDAREVAQDAAFYEAPDEFIEALKNELRERGFTENEIGMLKFELKNSEIDSSRWHGTAYHDFEITGPHQLVKIAVNHADGPTQVLRGYRQLSNDQLTELDEEYDPSQHENYHSFLQDLYGVQGAAGDEAELAPGTLTTPMESSTPQSLQSFHSATNPVVEFFRDHAFRRAMRDVDDGKTPEDAFERVHGVTLQQARQAHAELEQEFEQFARPLEQPQAAFLIAKTGIGNKAFDVHGWVSLTTNESLAQRSAEQTGQKMLRVVLSPEVRVLQHDQELLARGLHIKLDRPARHNEPELLQAQARPL